MQVVVYEYGFCARQIAKRREMSQKEVQIVRRMA